MVYIHNGILLSHKKECIGVSSNEVDDLEPIIQSEVSQKDKYHILTIYMESRKMVLKNLFTGQQWRNMENRLMDMSRGEERVRCMERVTWKLTLPYI